MADDAYLAGILAADGARTEALAWLSQEDGKERVIGDDPDDLDAAGSLRLIRALYDAGATRVIALDIEIDEWLETTSTLIVEAPDGPPEARARLFALLGDEAGRRGFDRDADHGQRLVMMHW